MSIPFSNQIANQLNLNPKHVEAALTLFAEGATLPFVARYRKEMTGSMDEVQLSEVTRLRDTFENLEKRRKTILEAIEEKGQLTDDLRSKIEQASTEAELEDLYLPYKSKRKTRADKARELGLEGLAKILMSQQESDPEYRAEQFVKGEVEDVDAALQGARDIIAEWVNENTFARNRVRQLFTRQAEIKSKVIASKKDEAQAYQDYWDMSQELRRIPSHRYLAMRRGEQEGFLRVSINIPQETALEALNKIFVKSRNQAAEQVEQAVADAYKRLLKPSIETEFATEAKQKADEGAIAIFNKNLRQLLLTAPVGEKRTLAIDPGFRTGCKVVCIDAQGNLLHNETIFPHPPQNESGKAAAKISRLVETFQIETIAIGNGTASRETERFIKKVRFNTDVQVFVVNEAGASIYSASKVARDEFPNYDVTVRGSVSIGRRLQDPLAELVKIDAKSIGVGQYQHDVDQKKLQESLDQTVEWVVNQVGVQLNTASVYLLKYISGIGPTLAQKIVDYRKENNGFSSRNELLKVSGLGQKVYEQAAGFIRVSGSKNVLDNTAVHPESYALVKQMAKDVQLSLSELIGNKEAIESIDLNAYVTDQIGLPTLTDVKQELLKPGRDPRQKAKVFEFDPNVKSIADLHEGMILPGVVSNVTYFGAFVNIGIKENGLIHVSEMADAFVSDPSEYVSLDQNLMVKVISVDAGRKRIALSLKGVKQ